MTLSSQVMQCIYDMFEGLGKRPSGDPKERAGNIFRKIDINGDGDLTENEFIKGCSEDKVASYLFSKYFLFFICQEIMISSHDIFFFICQEMMELLNSLFASITGGS